MEYRVVCNTLMPKKEDVDTYKLWLENTSKDCFIKNQISINQIVVNTPKPQNP